MTPECLEEGRRGETTLNLHKEWVEQKYGMSQGPQKPWRIAQKHAKFSRMQASLYSSKSLEGSDGGVSMEFTKNLERN